MTRKDYELIAAALKQARDAAPGHEWRLGVLDAADLIGRALRRDNPRFEKARFMAAAGFPADL